MALALLILVLFPVISVTDDLMAAANPAETEMLSRRNLQFSASIVAIPAILRPGDSVLTETDAPRLGLIASLEFQVSVPAAPALAPVENRPPPEL